jgi:hypothetical protein
MKKRKTLRQLYVPRGNGKTFKIGVLEFCVCTNEHQFYADRCKECQCFAMPIPDGRMCAEHELLFIARHGHPSTHDPRLKDPHSTWDIKAPKESMYEDDERPRGHHPKQPRSPRSTRSIPRRMPPGSKGN